MKDKFNHIERRGLPGGPNEQFTYVTGVFSTDGYRYDSPDVNNIYNVIPSGNISMREKNGEPLKKGPILGIDNLGNKQLMQPGFDYQFPGDQVFELPMAQIGKETKKNIPRKKKFEQRLNNPTLSLKNEDGTYSTHEMMSFESDGKYYAAPTIIERNGKLERLSKHDAYNYAMQNKEYKEFKTEKEAQAYAQGNYKMGTPLQEKGQLHTYNLDEHVVRPSYTQNAMKEILSGIPKFPEGGEIDPPKPAARRNVVLIENPKSNSPNPFLSEADELKKFLNTKFPNESVELIPSYGQDIYENLSKSDANTRLFMLAHSGDKMFGVDSKDFTGALNNSKYENCYLGTCWGNKVLAEADDFPKNITYRDNQKWYGFNFDKNSQALNGEDAIKHGMFNTYKDYNKYVNYKDKELELQRLIENNGDENEIWKVSTELEKIKNSDIVSSKTPMYYANTSFKPPVSKMYLKSKTDIDFNTDVERNVEPLNVEFLKRAVPINKKALGGLLMAQKGKYIPPNFSDFDYGQTASESTSRTYNSRELNRPVSTATPSVSKQQVVESVQEAQRLRKIQEDERRARIADSEAAKKTPYTLQNFPEVFARETQAIGDKLQSAYIPDILNPAMMLGDLASGLGRVPLNIQQGNYGQAALDIGMPLAIGAFAGLGAKTTGQFANNLVNPLAGTGQFLTTKTPLKNTYKLNPFAFKPNPEAYYRGIGRTGLDDALESRLIRTPEGSFYNDMYMSPDINIAKDYSRNKPTWTWQEVESTIPGKPSEIKQVFSPVDRTSYIAEIPKSSLSDVRNINELVSTTRNQIPLDQARLLKEDWLRGYKQVDTPTQLPGSPNIQQAGFFDTKGALQKYPKGKLTQEEIEAYKNSDYYKQNTKDHLDAKNKYGDSWTLPNYAQENLLEAFVTGNRSKINPILYGGRNWRTSDYVTAGLVGTAFPGVLGLHSLVWAPPAIRSKALKSLGIQGVPGGLSSQDTTIDITNRPMSFAKVNQTTDGDIIIGGEFIEDVNNTVRKAKDWLVASDTYSDKKYSSKDIQSFYGIEDGKFKVGKADEFNAETEIVPRRFGAINIDKATLNGEEMRLLDKQGNPIYQNTPNTGKFILYSPSTGKAEFTYINTGKSGVNKVNNFLKKNKDAQYIHLDNGRYEYYGINPEGLTEQDFKNYYEQDFKRKGNPGYNMVIKQYGGDLKLQKYQTGDEIAFGIYKKYINGDYIGTLEEGKAKKTYDRLNRIYYKDAKSSGMSVPNYIMTNVVTLQ